MMFLGTRKCWNVSVAKLVPPLPSIIPTFAPLDGTFVLSDIICAPAEPLFPRWRADCFLDHVGPYLSSSATTRSDHCCTTVLVGPAGQHYLRVDRGVHKLLRCV